MIDQKFLQGCTDEQIEKGVAWLKVVNENLPMIPSSNSELLSGWANAALTFPNNCCSIPNDAWPIILESRIGITFGQSGERAVKMLNGKTIQVINENPLRAAMEVYLLTGNKS